MNSPDNQGKRPPSGTPEFTPTARDNLYTRSKKTYEAISKLVVSKVAPDRGQQPQAYLKQAETMSPKQQPKVERESRLVPTLIIIVVGIIAIAGIVAVIAAVQKSMQADGQVVAATEAMRKGDNKAAIHNLNSAEGNGYRKPKLYLMRAAAEANVGENEPAIQDFTSALQSNPKDPVALIGRAACYLKSGQHASAISDCDSALGARADYGEALRLKAAAEAASNKLDEALKDCDKYLSLYSKDPDPEVLNTRAYARFKLGQTEQAIRDLDDIIKLKPDNADSHMLRAECYYKLGQYDKTISDLSAALKINPASIPALLMRAEAYVQAKNAEDALDDLQLVISHAPSTKAYATRAFIYSAQKKYEAAVDDYDKALEISPDDAAIHAKREEAFKEFKKTQPSMSVTADAENPAMSLPALKQGAAALTAKGYQAFKQGDATTAIANLSAAVRANPADVSARHYLAYAYMSAGDSIHAVEQFQALMSMGKLNDTDQMQFARALTAVGRNDEAVDLLKEVVDANPNNSWARISLVKLYIDAGLTVKAAKLAQDGLATATRQSDREAYQKLLRQTAGSQ